uniref:CSON009089 protein n=1 Tax=Culicoides sonorensis TaxID=179676 RepID=A0A336LE93_CULSO
MKFVRELINEREKVFDENINENNNNDFIEDEKTPRIMLDILLHGHKIDGVLTRKDIEDHVLTMISAGTETSALAISSAILFLGIHQEMQEKLYAEICENCPVDKEPFLVDYEMTRKMEYLEMIFKETVRLNPSVPNVGRVTGVPIPYDGLIIPARTEIYVSWFTFHRQKSIWGEDACEFSPERFLPENSINRHQFAWSPFSLGVRNCIGYTYAKMSFKISLIQFIRHFKVKTSLKWKDIEWQHDLHLHITKPHLISVEKR